MKKLTLVVAMFAFLAIVVNSYAEVQQVRLSGELRLRGYWTKNLDDNMGTHGVKYPSDVYFNQRTRVTVEADLEDKVLVVVTLQAQGTWGGEEGSGTAAGSIGGNGFHGWWRDVTIGRPSSTVYIAEGYVRLQEMFWSPLSLQLGRQMVHFGNGLIFSANEKENRFDGGLVSIDMADCGYRFDLLAAKLADADHVGADEINSHRDNDVYFLNFGFEPKSDSLKWLSKFEAYVGYLAGGQNSDSDQFTDMYIWIYGLRGDMKFMDEKLKVWTEFAYENGKVDWANHKQTGWLFDLGASFAFKDTKWTPVLSAGWTYASGTKDTDTKVKSFLPWFDYNTRGGIVVKPVLSNIHIVTVGLDTNPTEKMMLGIHGYWYRQAKLMDDECVGNWFVDNGGITRSTNGDSKSLGWEVDFVLGYNYSKDVKTNLIFGWFSPGKAFDCSCGSKAKDVLEVRGEMLINF